MALRTGLATGVPFSSGAERTSVAAVAKVLGHRDIVVEPDLLSSQRWTDEATARVQRCGGGKGQLAHLPR
jgi:hypothetical protein